MGDAQVFHYAIFLMRTGMSPYRQIFDINMPGSYLSEFVGLSLFGGSDLGWRLYDFVLLVTLIVAAVLISFRYNWYAGLYAGVIFALIHGSEGPLTTAERDEVMTVLLMLGYALAFLGVHRRRSLLCFMAGVAFSLAATIKPTAAAYGLLVGAAALLQLRKEGVRIFPFLREMVAATTLILLATLIFLLWRSSFHAFVQTTLSFGLSYSASVRPSFAYMLHYSTPRGLVLLLPLTIFLFFRNHSWRSWEFRAILGGVILGLLSYFAQGKGFNYHRYPFVAFALLWSGLEYAVALKKGRFNAVIGGTGLLVGTLLVAPFYLYRTIHFDQRDELSMALVKDLQRYPASQLQGSVQCLDGVSGCYSALYRLQLKQRIGLMGDQLMFASHPSSSVRIFRDEFLRDIQSAPPKLFIETSYRFGDRQTFNKVEAWPEFADFLRHNYSIVTQRTWGQASTEAEPLGYRIYLLNH